MRVTENRNRDAEKEWEKCVARQSEIRVYFITNLIFSVEFYRILVTLYTIFLHEKDHFVINRARG